MMLRIHLFGGVRVARADASELPLTHTSQVLLAYLLLQRHRRHPREVLASLLWGDQDTHHARSALNTAMWRLRRVLEPDPSDRGKYLVSSPSGETGFNPDTECWLDSEVFRDRLTSLKVRPDGTIEHGDVDDIDSTLSLYVGPLVDGMYSDWALAERERFRRLYVATLLVLMRHFQANHRYDRALPYALRAIEEEPLREDIHRDLMRLYDALGQRSLAARQFQTCRATLEQQLGIEPSPETRALYARLADSAEERRQGLEVRQEQAVAQLAQAIRGIEEIRAQLDQGIAVIQEMLTRHAALGPDRAPADSYPRRSRGRRRTDFLSQLDLTVSDQTHTNPPVVGDSDRPGEARASRPGDQGIVLAPARVIGA